MNNMINHGVVMSNIGLSINDILVLYAAVNNRFILLYRPLWVIK